MVLNEIVKILKEYDDFVIFPHVCADGDALGSSIALYIALKSINKNVVIVMEEELPYNYRFLPQKDNLQVYNEEEEKNYRVAVALDTGDLQRLGKRVELFRKSELTINIDHHPTNTKFGGINVVQPNSSAVGEIIYQLIKMMGLKITKEISECLYVAISTDTGGFKYSNTTSITHLIASDLISSGIDVAEISQTVFDVTSEEKVRLTGLAINSLKLMENGRLAVLTLTDMMFRDSKAREEDCDGIISLGRNIRGVEVAVMFRARENGEIKVNLRSNKYVDVSQVARNFSGGGHKRAAGCSVKGSLDEVKANLLSEIRRVL